MEFVTTESGRHTIQFENGYLIFSKITADHDKGYKYLCYAGSDTTTTCVSSSRAKKKRFAQVVEAVNFTVRIRDMKRNDKSAFRKNVISKISLSFLKKLMVEHCEGDYLPFNKIPTIAKAINDLEKDTDSWDDDPDIDDNWDDEDEVKPIKKPLKKVEFSGKKRKLKVKQKVSLKRVTRKKPLIKKGK
jgi:hypothetical protein